MVAGDMALPNDYDRALWLDPLRFQGLIGRVIASPKASYRDLFREDGFAKPISELKQTDGIAPLLNGL
jgi:hypothetical protein